MNGDFYGLPTERIENNHLRLEYLVNAGPRLVRLSLVQSPMENLLAEIPNKNWETPYGQFWIRGGHRLWHAPEAMPRTYIPDNEGLSVERTSDEVCLTGPIEAPTGIRKQIQIRLHDDRPALTLLHHLKNEGSWPVEIAAWAITQLPMGGTMILPQETQELDAHGLLPNRQLTFWPYTQLKDPRLRLDDCFVTIQANPSLPPVKVGYLNRSGWAGYLREGTFFCKRFEPQLNQSHVDFGCNVECYCNDLFIELETLGPLVRLEPGQLLEHVETWEIYPNQPKIDTPAEISTLISHLAL